MVANRLWLRKYVKAIPMTEKSKSQSFRFIAEEFGNTW